MRRLSNTMKDLVARQLELMREAIARSRELLKDTPRSDTFAGRKTQEPFPSEDDDIVG
jgi:hypothetical protein